MKNLFLLVISSLLFITASCADGYNLITPSKNIITESRYESGFTAINARGGVNLYISQGDTEKIEIQANDNVMPYVECFKREDELIIKIRDHIQFSGRAKTLNVYITTRNVDEIDVTGGSSITFAETFVGPSLDLDITGGGEVRGAVGLGKLSVDITGGADVELTGKCTELDFESTGGATFKSTGLVSQNAEFDVTGGAEISMVGSCVNFTLAVTGGGEFRGFGYVTDNARINVSGGADVELTTNKVLNVNVSGGGSIRYKGTASVLSNITGGGTVKHVD